MDMYKICFPTTNKGKIESMRKWVEPYHISIYPYKSKGKDNEFDEPQERTLVEIATKKAEYFKTKINNPLVVQDSGFYLEAVEGEYPGALVKPILSSIGIKGILNQVPVDNRNCFFRDVLAFWSPTYERANPKNPVKIFVSEVHGRVAIIPSTKTRKDMWSELWTIFIPNGFDNTLSELNEVQQKQFAEQTRSNKESNCFFQFANWLMANKHYLYTQGSLFDHN